MFKKLSTAVFPIIFNGNYYIINVSNAVAGREKSAIGD